MPLGWLLFCRYFNKNTSRNKEPPQWPTGTGTPKGLGVHWAYMFMGRGIYTGTGTGTTMTWGKVFSVGKECIVRFPSQSSSTRCKTLTANLLILCFCGLKEPSALLPSGADRCCFYLSVLHSRLSVLYRKPLCSAPGVYRGGPCSSGLSWVEK